MNKAKSNAERQRAFLQRNRDKGLVLARIWIHPSQRDRLNKYAARLEKEREES